MSTSLCSSSTADAISFFYSFPVPASIRSHAIVVYHLTRSILKVPLSEKVLVNACILYSIKLRNRTKGSSVVHDIWKNTDVIDCIALEMFIFECVRPKVIIVEGCLRVELKRLVTAAPSLHQYREFITRVALSLTKKLYRSAYCLQPATAARALLLSACTLLSVDVDLEEEEYQSVLVKEICRYLVSS